jgi:hypothetical protein
VPLFAGAAWFDPIEAELRERIRQLIENMIDQEAVQSRGDSDTKVYGPKRIESVSTRHKRRCSAAGSGLSDTATYGRGSIETRAAWDMLLTKPKSSTR